jgi:hypothetical protein
MGARGLGKEKGEKEKEEREIDLYSVSIFWRGDSFECCSVQTFKRFLIPDLHCSRLFQSYNCNMMK